MVDPPCLLFYFRAKQGESKNPYYNMRILSVLLLTLSVANFSFAQEEEELMVEREFIPKLEKLYLEGQYDKLEFKAYDMQYNDKYRSEPMLYMYLFLANWEFYNNDEYHAEFPNGLRDAIKWAVKFTMKDRDSLYRDMYLEEMQALQLVMMNEAEDLMAEEEWRKALSMYKNIVKLQPNNQVAYMMKAALETKEGQQYTAAETLEEAMLLINAIDQFENLPVVHQSVLRDFLVEYCAFWVKKNKAEIAEVVVEMAALYFEGDDELQEEVDSILYPEPETTEEIPAED